MKSGKIFFLFSVALIMVIWGWSFYDSIYVEAQAFKGQVESHLASVSQSRGDRINDWLLEKENDIQIIAGFSKVKELLKENTSSSEEAIKLSVDENARIISKEVENYIKAHSGMTLDHLRDSVEFNSIAVLPVGNDGYTVLVDKNTSIAKFHINPDLVGFDYDLVGEENKEGVAILKEAQNTNKDSSGFYNWLDLDGKVRKKYSYFSVIPAKTLDNFEFVLATTAYVEDYQTIKDVPEGINNYLKDFVEVYDYYNLVLISTDGHIIYMAQKMGNLGEGLEWKENLNNGLIKNYQKVKDSNNISFFGPFVGHYEEEFMKVSVMAPVYDGQNLLGFVGLIDDMEKPIEISTELTGLWGTGEIYLTNEEALIITPLRFQYLDLLTQSIKTENLENCMIHIERNERVSGTEFYEFLNYKGDLTLGTHKPISKIRWCLLAEIGKEEISEISIQSQIKGGVLFLFVTMLISFIFAFYIKGLLDRNYILEKRKIGKIFTKYRGGVKN